MKTQKCRFNQTSNGFGRHLSTLILSCVALLGLGLSAQAQFTGPTPFPSCSGTTSGFTATTTARNYVWTFENIIPDFSITSLPSATNVYNGSPLNVPSYTTIDFDDCGWVSFVTNHSTNEIVRLEYGLSPLNPPATTSLGTFGTSNQLQGIDVLKDASGTWYGFAVNGTQLIRWQFAGNTLMGTPTNVTTMNFPANLAWPHQLGIKKFDDLNEFVGFVANRNGSITRIDFGSTLSSTPTLTNLPSTNLTACNFVLYKEFDSWYMLTSNLITDAVSRLQFGGNIQNNSPSVTNLGNLGMELDLPRGIFLLPNCDGKPLFGYIINENGDFIKLDFNSSILNTPTTTNLGSLSNKNNHALAFPYGGSLYALVPDFSAHSIRRLKLLDFPTPNRIDYYSSSFDYTFTLLPDPHKSVRFYADLGGAMGTTTGCVDFDVSPCAPKSSNLLSDPSSGQEQEHALYQNSPNPFKSFTTINYYIGKMESSGYILIQNALGKEVARYTINTTGDGKIDLNWSNLSPGVYYYSLIVDEYRVDTKKMAFSRENTIN